MDPRCAVAGAQLAAGVAAVGSGRGEDRNAGEEVARLAQEAIGHATTHGEAGSVDSTTMRVDALIDVSNHRADKTCVVAAEPRAFTSVPALGLVSVPEPLRTSGDKAVFLCKRCAHGIARPRRVLPLAMKAHDKCSGAATVYCGARGRWEVELELSSDPGDLDGVRGGGSALQGGRRWRWRCHTVARPHAHAQQAPGPLA